MEDLISLFAISASSRVVDAAPENRARTRLFASIPPLLESSFLKKNEQIKKHSDSFDLSKE